MLSNNLKFWMRWFFDMVLKISLDNQMVISSNYNISILFDKNKE